MARSEVVSKKPNNKLSKEEKREKVLANVKRTSNSINTEKAKEYMSDPNVIKFTDSIVKRCFGKTGRPTAFSSVDELNSDVREYLQLCYDTGTVPTITSAALWLGCDRDTLYAHCNNSDSVFSDTCKNLINICHFSLENGAIKGRVNSVLYMFLSKNYFGLKDDKNITVTPVDNKTINNSDTMQAIQKQIEEENIPNADISED